MPPPLAADAARGVFVMDPIRRKLGQLFNVGFQDRFGELEKGEPEIVRQQIGIRMRQAFQQNDGGRSSEVNHAFTQFVPASVREYTAGSIQAGSVLGSIQPPQRWHQ
jgi:hypothetical protein